MQTENHLGQRVVLCTFFINLINGYNISSQVALVFRLFCWLHELLTWLGNLMGLSTLLSIDVGFNRI
ncbi:hypothetical protein XELAEV_18009000mg [Xenopus laevis]|uniref:Uncharacterized protein n=1 Tax=Xenopus laevis TaxID=8355 RepID=A0A974I0F2_XENLA|nr:hypothetical protein XELAEV_18009000mg [Xenopus laevis]